MSERARRPKLQVQLQRARLRCAPPSSPNTCPDFGRTLATKSRSDKLIPKSAGFTPPIPRMISRRQVLKWLIGLGLGASAAAAYATVLEPLLSPRTTRYDIRPKRWQAGLDLSIAVIADLHACTPWMDVERIESVVERTNALGADLVLLLGDYEARHHYMTARLEVEDWSKPLARLKAPLGVHAILGNHDWWDDRAVQLSGQGPPYAQRALERLGIPVYDNDAVRLAKDGHPFWL